MFTFSACGPGWLLAMAAIAAIPAGAATIYNFQSFNGPGSNGGGTTVNAINNNGAVAGFSSDNAATPTLFTNFIRNPDGTLSILSLAGDQLAMANGINNSDTVVGGFSNGTAFVDTGGILTPLGAVTGTTTAQTAFGVSDNGLIVGQYADSNTGTTPGYLLKNGTYTTLSPTPVAVVTNAQSVNDNGVVAGFYSADGVHQHGFLYNSTTNFFTLAPDPVIPNLVLTQFLGINDQGIVAGYYQLPDGSQHGLLYNSNTKAYTFLDDPNAAVSGVSITQITGITDSGELAGFYVDATTGLQRGFIATPAQNAVPEPGSFALLLGPAVLLLACRRSIRARLFASAVFLSTLAAGSASADTMYAFDFTGTITSGTASGFNPALSPNMLTQFADLTGAQVSGALLFDLGLAPSPTVTNSGGFTQTAIQGTAPPVFVSDSFTINGFTVPAGFFPMPTVFNLPAIPVVQGSTVTTSQSNQLLQFSTQNPAAAQSIIAQMNFNNSWNGAMTGNDINALDVLASSLTPFFAVPPTGSLPSTFGPETSGQNGVFLFSMLNQNPAVTANFGITAWWDVNGSFTLDSARGGLVTTPEPNSLALIAVVVGLVAIRSRYDRRSLGPNSLLRRASIARMKAAASTANLSGFAGVAPVFPVKRYAGIAEDEFHEIGETRFGAYVV